jgi:anti-anti-sigma factor
MSTRRAVWHLPFCTIEDLGNESLLRVEGEIDLASVPVLRSRLQEIAARGASFTIDLRHVPYMDSAGVKTLEQATELVAQVTILVAPGIVSKLLALDLLDERFTIRQVVDSPSTPADG